MDIIKSIQSRRSVRTYSGQPDAPVLERLKAFSKTVENPYGSTVQFRFLDAKEHGLTSPVVTGTDLYVGGKIGHDLNACVAFGYSFETFLLYAQELGVGSVWLGGTMNRGAFEKAMELAEGEFMPCASPLGYPAEKMSIREGMMRKAIKADERLTFEDLFFDGSVQTPLLKEKAGRLLQPLEMVRLAPSAVNKQPWRVIKDGGCVHFYLKRSKGFGRDSALDMQKIDMGIALCHFDLTAKACELKLRFLEEDPGIVTPQDWEYIASYEIGS